MLDSTHFIHYTPPEPTGDFHEDIDKLCLSLTTLRGEAQRVALTDRGAQGFSLALTHVLKALLAISARVDAATDVAPEEQIVVSGQALTPCEQLVMSVAINELCNAAPAQRANMSTALPFWLDKLRNANTLAPPTITKG